MKSTSRGGHRAAWHGAAWALLGGVFGGMSGAVGPSWAQGAGVAVHPPIVVTGAREPLAPERVAGDVVVIDAETIRATLADSLGDLLRREAGVQLSRAGGPGQGTGVLLRGAGAGQTVVLVDGVRVGSATLGLAALEQIGLAQVERIEILRGPGSTLFGADAIGGVVQVFTRRAAGAPHLELQARAGGHDSREASATASLARGDWELAASVSEERSAGVSVLRPGDRFGSHNPDRDGYRLEAAHARVGWQPLPGQRLALTLLRTRLDAQYDSAEYAPPTYAPDPSPDFRNRVRTDLVGLEWRAELGRAAQALVRATSGLDDARVGARQVDRFRTRREAVSAQLGLGAGAAGRLTFALEHGTERGESTSYLAPVERTKSAAVAALAGAAGGWAWQGELRHDEASDTPGVTTGRIGAAWRLAEGWRVRALAGTTFRAPSFNDLHYPGYGVPSLRPEQGRSAELGLAWQAGPGRLEATLHRNRVSDLIGYESDRRLCPPGPAYDFGCARNVSRALLQGVTLSASTAVGALALRTTADWLSARDAATDARLPRRAVRQASVQATWTAGRLSLDGALLVLGDRPDGGRMLAPETTLDLGARWTFAPRWQLQARLLNAADARTEPGRDYQGVGRQAWLGVRTELGGAGVR